MKLANIDIGKLSISTLNMRHGKTPPDVSDILPSIRARGVLVPLLVRPSGEGETFEIVAGRRRYFSVCALLEEGTEVEPLPCAIMAPGDDAAALEASLIENLARLDPDEVQQCETFTRLVKEGRSAEQIGQTFGLTDLYVRRILALGNLHPRIRGHYRNKDIDAQTARHLTLASKSQQKDWLKLYDSEDEYAPTGPQLKAWLFGGGAISTKAALFDIASYKGRIVADLFGDNGYFEDADAFWTAQNEAIAARRDALLAEGWEAVELLETGERFCSWEHEATPKAKGGKVYITVCARGDVEIHAGYLPAKEAKKARADEARATRTEADKVAALAGKSEVSGPMQTYIDLHRHAAVRATLLDHPAVALRLMLAHAIAGSPLWTVRIESQTARNDAITESVETSMAETRFDEHRRRVLALLDLSPETPTVADSTHRDEGLAAIFARLLTLPDADVMAVLTVVMGETLSAGSAVVEAVGNHIRVDMAALWTPDDAFFGLIRERAVINAILREVGGKRAADGNVMETAKTQKAVIRDFLAGANDRKQVENWMPKWLLFPAASYTARPFAPLSRWKGIAALFKAVPVPQPARNRHRHRCRSSLQTAIRSPRARRPDARASPVPTPSPSRPDHRTGGDTPPVLLSVKAKTMTLSKSNKRNGFSGPKAEGHKRAAVIYGVAVRCECGWSSCTWYGKGASGNAHGEWRGHVDTCLKDTP